MIFKGYERIDTASVYDGLDSTSTTEALSARQGNVLNEKINQGRLVAQTTLTAATQTVTIEGLDIIRDGGVYDIEICGKTAAAADVFVRVNNLSPSIPKHKLKVESTTFSNNVLSSSPTYLTL